MATAREKIIRTTCDLLERQGFHASGLNEIVQASGAPKGSLYHYFPGGKTEIAVEAVRNAAETTARIIAEHLAAYADPAEGVRTLLEEIARRVEETGYAAGGPLMLVALETVNSSEPINRACRQAYRHIQAVFSRRLMAAGMSEAAADPLALLIVSTIEGATLLSRTLHSTQPLREAAGFLAEHIRLHLTSRHGG
ncbi:MAG: TetR/AcrR family transcriptional regulator [Chloroflexota bacterium]